MPKCRKCNAEIHFVESAHGGRPMPCDMELETFVLESGHVGKGYVPHWATCVEEAGAIFRRRANKAEASKQRNLF